MRATVLIIALAIISSPVYAHETKKQRQQRHKHVQLLHKEHKVIEKWMTKAESDCAHDADFHACYIKSIQDQRAAHPRFSPETEKTLNNLTKIHRRKE